MTLIFQIFAILAGLLHVLFWLLESVLFTRPPVYRRFGVRSQAEAETLRSMALNQGFYNLFLAVGAIGGAIAANTVAGRAIAIFCCGSMVAAALVLVISNPKLARAAVIQAVMPLLALIFAVV